jgi:hypothetical protein
MPPARQPPIRTYTPAALNNRGVLLIEAGRFAAAAHCFKRASKIVISDFSQHSNTSSTGDRRDALHRERTVQSGGRQGGSRGQVHQSEVLVADDFGRDAMPLRSKPVSPLRQQRSGGNSLLVDTATVEEMSKVADSPKASPSAAPKVRTKSETKAQEDILLNTAADRLQQTKPWHNLARPIWLQSECERRNQVESTALSATLLYNLGLSFHLCAAGEDKAERMAGQQQDGDAKPVVLYSRALMFYKMSSDIMQRDSMATMAVGCPVLVVALHNMTLIHTIHENHEMATEVRCKLVHLLRSMVETSAASRQQHPQGQSPREKGYEQFLLRLLTLPKNSSVAAAA